MGSSASENQTDQRVMIPRLASGQLLGRTPHQIFCRTTPVLTNGMCGGPVMWVGNLGGKNTRGKRNTVVGMVEGIVPADHPQVGLREAAVFIEAGDIRNFVNDVEEGKIEPVDGGDIQSFIANDKDPEKMDVSKILSGPADEENAKAS